MLKALRDGLQEHGFTVPRNLQIEIRHSGVPAQISAFAAELVQAGVELIVTHGTPAVEAVKKAAESLPIVFATIGDPVGAGLVQSLRRPGGNITGLSILASDLSHKRLEIVKETMPRLKRVAMLSNPSNESLNVQLAETVAAARMLGLELQSIPVQHARELESAVSTAASAHADAIIITSDSIQMNRRTEIVERAMSHRIPAISEYREIALAGALLSYGPSREDCWRRAASYVARILHGANPGDLPVEQPSKYNLVINLRTVRALGVDVSPLLFRADEVIE
ncbi:ABC transporter substrate-binding protein [Microvirga arabica]|uniref:ABC transporter substrate-binding protein n=2 Tax=Microvirga arabica TaxID=1128671 RepID=UPI0036205913